MVLSMANQKRRSPKKKEGTHYLAVRLPIPLWVRVERNYNPKTDYTLTNCIIRLLENALDR